MVIAYSKGKGQPGKVANPARGHLNRENIFVPVPVRAWEFGLARRVRQSSRLVSPCSSLTHIMTQAEYIQINYTGIYIY